MHPQSTTTHCQHCAKEFPTTLARLADNRGKFCSKPCYDDSRKCGEDRTCKVCGKTFWIRPSEIAKGKGPYCSTQCFRGSSPIVRFMRNVQKTDDCWLWTACRNKCGYGTTTWGTPVRKGLANRASWELHFGAIPEGQCVLHRCDNPACVRPDHLFLGTHQENMKDREEKGRGGNHKGNANGRAKLTDEQVLEIRRLYAAGGVTQVQLAKRFNVGGTVISFIITRRTWQHI